ncbi:BZRD [Hepatospora eriocheir]|uniref:BZRD n=1 Tax=Hepatospora eriocheir TaxID=1081669 RepID=A0A1X0QI36_9MICR|nr:BZRD [Hepatospora eriocheir]
MNFYRNKKILITGGSKGIGKEIVEMLLRSNAKVYSISRTTSGIKNVRFTEILMDLTDIKTKSLDLLKDWKEIEFDVLINNVGSNPGMKKFEEHSMEDIEKHLFLNVTVNLFTMKLFKFKKVVFINSVLSMTGVPLNSIYCASKHLFLL